MAIATTAGGFADPAAVGFNYEEALDHLLVVVPHSFERDVMTDYVPRNAVLATIYDITAGETFEEILIFPRVLVASLRRQLGQTVLGTLAQGVAKPDQSPPWVLLPESSNAKAVAAAGVYLLARVGEAS